MLHTEITFSTKTAVQQINFLNLNVVENYFRNNKIMLYKNDNLCRMIFMPPPFEEWWRSIKC